MAVQSCEREGSDDGMGKEVKYFSIHIELLLKISVYILYLCFKCIFFFLNGLKKKNKWVITLYTKHSLIKGLMFTDLGATALFFFFFKARFYFTL